MGTKYEGTVRSHAGQPRELMKWICGPNGSDPSRKDIVKMADRPEEEAESWTPIILH